jgi:hypothetical protein
MFKQNKLPAGRGAARRGAHESAARRGRSPRHRRVQRPPQIRARALARRPRGGRAAERRGAVKTRIFDPIRRVVAFYEMPRRWARGAAAQSAHASRIAS